jgi:hypothetical protein
MDDVDGAVCRERGSYKEQRGGRQAKKQVSIHSFQVLAGSDLAETTFACMLNSGDWALYSFRGLSAPVRS